MKPQFGNEVAIFALAVQFLTRLPIPVGDAYTPARLAASPRYYPLVGVLIGALSALVYVLTSLWFAPALAVLLTCAAGLLLTGAFHEDGLADTFDGLGGSSREQMLTIMRDSRVGTFGVLALTLALAIKASALIELTAEHVVIALIVAHGLSRLSAVLVIASSRYTRDHGTAKPTADGIDAVGLAIAVTTGALLLAWLALVVGGLAAGAVLGGALVGHIVMRCLFERRLGGYTGDTLGAVQQLSELGVYLGLLAWASS